MPKFSISEVAGTFGLRASTIRYYEQIGILPPAMRISGQRRYDTSVLHRLAVIQQARGTGFTLDEIRKLFFGFREGTPPSKRWNDMSSQKLVELDSLSQRIKTMQSLLTRLRKCECNALDECGRRLLLKNNGDTPKQSSRADL